MMINNVFRYVSGGEGDVCKDEVNGQVHVETHQPRSFPQECFQKKESITLNM